MPKVFAEQYERVHEGKMDLILFPRDVEWRRKLFPDRVFEHPAKANMYLVEELIKYLTEPGDTILDPFGGTGTLLIAALYGRNVVLIEIEPHFISLLEETETMWKEGVQLPVIGEVKGPGRVFIKEGDCRQKLQDLDFLCDAVITSPPYSSLLSGQTGLKEGIGRSAKAGALSQYTGKDASSQNLGRLNPFYFKQAMGLVYQRMVTRLTPEAKVAFIVKDAMKAGVRQFLSTGIIKQANRAGLELLEWFKWKPPGIAQQKLMKSKGFKVVEDEDVLIFGKKA